MTKFVVVREWRWEVEVEATTDREAIDKAKELGKGAWKSEGISFSIGSILGDWGEYTSNNPSPTRRA